MSQPITDSPEGVLLVDKPQGITSHDVVSRMRKLFRIKKVGHAGTLDPMATGLLLIMIGKATKISQYLMSNDKDYTGTVLLGIETDSQDAEGEVVAEKPVPDLSKEAVLAEMKTFLGDQYQTPPMYSAKKVNGQALYKLARQGKTIEREARVIRFNHFEMTDFDLPRVSFSVGCSKGAYIRTLAHDLGNKLGCGGHLCVLRRTVVGKFSIENANTIEELQEMSPSVLRKKLIPINQAVPSHVL
ncbi:MAG: tRNA pseudouridine(55) synthase TruB [Opitutaceae bacterium]